MTKRIFISGAAQGIGASIARLFYQKGYRVGIYDIHETKAHTLANELGENAKAGHLDVSDYQQWQTALQDFVDWAGGLDILVNNAGILYSGDFEATNIDHHHRTIDVNVKGVLNGCHAALPYLKQQAHARIINLSSASAIYGQPDLVSYSSSKFAVRGITEGLDIEWAKYGIRVLDVMPLFVNTDMVTNMDAGTIKNMGVHLQANDVAQAVWQTATSQWPLLATHHPVGFSTRLMFHLSQFSPQCVNRWANTFLSRK
ncbi:MAG: SDR family oxidoreductase [Acinetobacter populi]|jgi:NAD(P)-dependent dehydrogenase (short-subunit alcohol dehydrogenase family)|uniref:SDR family oxidoreductase n=1 Tax=Acinetobacter populi TaxID=1582270 RepID=UPI00235501FC|nr:SDR family oxidoreductase [Acinetobacter populi]MCH4247519.1 SDR family oxidoreductase [Acinetobacter populi]